MTTIINSINNTVGGPNSGGTNALVITNTSNTASSDSELNIVVGGTSAGDPYVQFAVSATNFYALGIDNSASDSFKLTYDTSPVSPSSGSTFVSYSTAGQINYPLQPAFLAYLATTQTNVTGNGTSYTVGTAALTEVFDQNNNFNTNGTFTAPVTGKYFLQFQVSTTGNTVQTNLILNLVTSNRTYQNVSYRPASSLDNYCNISTLADMDAADTATYTAIAQGEAGVTDDVIGASTLVTYVSGKLCT